MKKIWRILQNAKTTLYRFLTFLFRDVFLAPFLNFEIKYLALSLSSVKASLLTQTLVVDMDALEAGLRLLKART